VAVTLLRARAGLVLHGTTWVSSEEMVECGVDELSRVRYEERYQERGRNTAELFRETTVDSWRPLFELLDPNQSVKMNEYHRNFIAVSKAIYTICEDHIFV
jgi:aryl carrier-like protein